MAATTHTGALDPLIREILSSAASDSRKLAPGRVQKQFRSAASQDYARQLRALFDPREMRELFADLRSALPALNTDIFRIQETRRLAGVAADWHELGHHLTSRTFDLSRPIQLRRSFASIYQDHLADPLEIAADMVSALAAYPRPAAQRLFGRFVKSGEAPDIESLVLKARAHLRSVARFDFR